MSSVQPSQATPQPSWIESHPFVEAGINLGEMGLVSLVFNRYSLASHPLISGMAIPLCFSYFNSLIFNKRDHSEKEFFNTIYNSGIGSGLGYLGMFLDGAGYHAASLVIGAVSSISLSIAENNGEIDWGEAFKHFAIFAGANMLSRSSRAKSQLPKVNNKFLEVLEKDLASLENRVTQERIDLTWAYDEETIKLREALKYAHKNSLLGKAPNDLAERWRTISRVVKDRLNDNVTEINRLTKLHPSDPETSRQIISYLEIHSPEFRKLVRAWGNEEQIAYCEDAILHLARQSKRVVCNAEYSSKTNLTIMYPSTQPHASSNIPPLNRM